MMSKSLTAALLVSLAACAGGPRPAAVGPAAPLPVGTYEFAGHVPAVGSIFGLIHVSSEGVVSLSRVSLPCPQRPDTADRVLSTSCRVMDLHLVGDPGSERQRASFTVAVTETGRFTGLCASHSLDGMAACMHRQGRIASNTTRRFKSVAEVRRLE